jgi:hypothetical protein
MARKTIPARPSRDRSRDDASLLLRSAESLGRMIGSLQRQLDVAARQLAGGKPNGDARKSSGAKRSMTARTGTTTAAGNARRKSSAGSSAARNKNAKKR